MRSQRKGELSAITQVKVCSPEIHLIVQGQGFHRLEASILLCDTGECSENVPGSKSMAGSSMFASELGRAMLFPKKLPTSRRGRGGSKAAWQSD